MLQNHNKLLWRVEGAEGVKTGYTKAAGRILVSSASRQGRRLIAVTIDAPDDWNDHTALLKQGFEGYTATRLIAEDQRLGSVLVAGGTCGEVPLMAGEEFSYAVAPGEKLTVELPGSGFVYAPVEEGTPAGFAHVLLDGAPVGKVPLYYGGDSETLPEPSLWEKLFGGKS